MLLLLRSSHTSAASRCVRSAQRGRFRGPFPLPSKAMASGAGGDAASALAAAKAKLRSEMKARLREVPDEALAAECESR